MKVITFLLATLFTVTVYCQDGITFSVENLAKPEKHFRMRPSKTLYEELILSDIGMSQYRIKEDNIDFQFNIIAKSQLSDSLVNFGYHSFFYGMYQAYADHRPFVLSPDMIWLLISQGFARHVSANYEKLSPHFVDFSGRLSLIVETDEVTLDNPDSPWEKIFPEFTKQIGKYTGDDFIKLMSSDFTTTTPIEKVASEITIMEAMKPYFEFLIIYPVCGIPEITLQGTTEDWQKILDKTRQLKQYHASWWTKELEPILEEFVKASKGNIDREFWRNMFKCHSQKQYGAPDIIDGWIVKFFPYDKDGQRNNLKKLKGGRNLPEEIVKVDVHYIDRETGLTIPLELWAGFIGLEQNKENYALTPKIGWMIRKKDLDNIGLKQKFESDNKSDWGEISIRVKEIPSDFFEFKEIKSLRIYFIDRIIIPDQLAKIKIGSLLLSGKINKSEIKRIRQLFPNIYLRINGEIID